MKKLTEHVALAIKNYCDSFNAEKFDIYVSFEGKLYYVEGELTVDSSPEQGGDVGEILWITDVKCRIDEFLEVSDEPIFLNSAASLIDEEVQHLYYG